MILIRDARQLLLGAILDAMAALPPEIGPYRVVRPLGQGGMGTVLLAEDSRLSRLVALKTFAGVEARADHARQQLLSEARAAAALNHPNIASVHDVLDVEGQVVIVFEYVEGETLAARLAKGPLLLSVAIDISHQLCDALVAAHAQGIVHRDLKPGNVILAADGRAKILDFGIARAMPSDPASFRNERTTSAMFVGTVGYASPEQCLGQQADARADIFALCVIMFEMLTGTRPFTGADVSAVVRAMLHDAPPSAARRTPGVPAALDRLITRGLSANPEGRPQTARELREGLRAFTSVDSPRPRPASTPRRWVLAGVLAAALALAVAGPLVFRRGGADVTASKPPVVAVVPLTNASGDDSKEYLAVGVAEHLTTRLAALRSVTVLSRAAVASARSPRDALPALAEELDATYLVSGSVQTVGPRLRIDVSLIRRDASVAWAETVEGTSDTMLDLQTRLASGLGQALAVQLSAADRASLSRQPTASAEALADYWRGRALLERRDIKGNVDAALLAFASALDADPRFAIAHAARGEALWTKYLDTRDPATAKAAIDSGTTALRLDPEEPGVRYSLALSLAGSGRLDEAVEELQRALALQPNYDDARRELGQILARQGRVDEAVSEFEKAIALRPGFWEHQSRLGVVLLQAGRYDQAIKAFSQVTALQPDSAVGFQQLGVAYHSIGDPERALDNYRRAIAISPSPQALSNIGALLHERGDFQGAVDAYRSAIAMRPTSHVTHRNLGDALARLGLSADAERAYRQAIALVRAELGVDPRNARNLAFLSVYLAKVGDREDAQRQAEAARALAPEDPQVLYRCAVVYALAGAVDRALRDVTAAVARGYSRTLVATDEDLIGLRRLAAFQALAQGDSKEGGRP
ncbi:MAG: protein kinase domain-containing protein [Acidobacteriota bacterium]